jgi:hypothetical protein
VSVPCPPTRQLARTLAICAVTTAAASALALAASFRPTVHTNRSCYLVGQRVTISGAGFAPRRGFEVTIDGVDFGQSETNAAGAFSGSLIPGGLHAGQAQQVDKLNATDGTSTANARFTVTRKAGGRLQASSGNPHTLRAPFEVWGFALDGGRRTVYLHYLGPSGRPRRTVVIGRTGGQCGYLRTDRRRVFPFSPSLGRWTLQLDTRRRSSPTPGGPVARIRIQIH